MNWLQLLDIGHKILTLGAIVAGAVWALYHYRRGTPYSARLEPTIVGKFISSDQGCYILVSLELKNTGSARVMIDQEGTAVRLLQASRSISSAIDSSIGQVTWQHLATYQIFPQQAWIEPAEVITESRLLDFSGENVVAFLAEMYVVAEGNYWIASDVLLTHVRGNEKELS